MTLQLNGNASLEGAVECSLTFKPYFVKTQWKTVLVPISQKVLQCILTHPNIPEDTVVELLSSFEKPTGLCLTSSLAKSDDAKRTVNGSLNVTSTIITLTKDTKRDKNAIFTPKQASYVQHPNLDILTEHLNQSL